MSTQRSLVFILVDSSASMSDLLSNSESKIDFAKKTLKSQLPSLIDLKTCEVALADFRAGNDNIVHFVPFKGWQPIGFDRHRSTFKNVSEFCLNGWIDAIRQPSGKTPIAEAIKTIASIFKDYPEAKKRIFLLTNGMENCGGDCIAAIDKARKDGIDFTIDVLGIALSEEESNSVTQIAFKSGGTCKNIPNTVDELAEDVVRLTFEHLNLSSFVKNFVDGNDKVTLDEFSKSYYSHDFNISNIKDIFFDDLPNVALFYSEECKELKPVTVVFLDENGVENRNKVLSAFKNVLAKSEEQTLPRFVIFWTKLTKFEKIPSNKNKELVVNFFVKRTTRDIKQFTKEELHKCGIFDVFVNYFPVDGKKPAKAEKII